MLQKQVITINQLKHKEVQVEAISGRTNPSNLEQQWEQLEERHLWKEVQTEDMVEVVLQLSSTTTEYHALIVAGSLQR
jgi:hypothetical protein